jgi:molybdopterin synthase catalytic subunit
VNGFFSESPIPVEALEEGARGDEGKSVVTLQVVLRRDREGTDELDHVVYEADLVRAEDEVLGLRRDVSERWKGQLLFRHRLGAVRVGETVFFIAVTSAKRDDALAACHNVLERVRHMPGVRKKDYFRDGSSRYSLTPHETILLSDDAFTLPQS